VQCEIETRNREASKKNHRNFENFADCSIKTAGRRTAKVAKIRRKQRNCDKAFVPLQASAKRAKTKENSVDSNSSVLSSSGASSSSQSSGRGTERWAVGAETGRGAAENETATTATAVNAGRFMDRTRKSIQYSVFFTNLGDFCTLRFYIFLDKKCI